jgi:shikimate 5-dehydrogenase
MDRLVADAKADWRFVTAEVAGQNVRVAVDGVRALNFDGLIFLQPVAISYGLTMETLTQAALNSGFLNVARRDHANWLADNIDGIALAGLLRDRRPAGTVMVYGSMLQAQLLHGADAELAKQVVCVIDAESNTAAGDWPNRDAPIPTILRSSLSEAPSPFDVLIVDRQLTNLDVGLLRGSLSQQTIAIDLLFGREYQPSNSEMMPELQWISPENLLCYQLKSMFEFVTGQTAEIKSVQEYLDEYSSWSF